MPDAIHSSDAIVFNLLHEEKRAVFLSRPLVWLCFLSVFVIAGCAGKAPRPESLPSAPEAVRVEPLADPGVFPVPPDEALRLSKGLAPARQGLRSWLDMRFAVDQSLEHVRSKPAAGVAVDLPDLRVTYGELARSLERLKRDLPFLDAAPELLAVDFRWMRIGPDFGFTGYYEPEIAASRVRKGPYQYPLYKRPPDLKRRRPYHSRHAIDCKGALRGRGLELAWVEDPVDIFMLQIQGSGRLRFEDGSVRHVLYNGQNGHKYVSLGRVMVDRGLMKREEVSMFSIRDWLAAHPEQTRELLDANPSYVFFKLGKPGVLAANGSMGRRLTPWVSVATDQGVLPNGALTLMNLSLPDGNGEHRLPFNALTLPQDTGGAIKRNRVDLFCGSGRTATHTASYLDTRGAVFLLLPR